MKNYLIAVIALSLLNGCGKKGEDQVIGKWSFSGNIAEEISGEAKKIPIVCNLEFKKDSTYKEDCQAKLKDDDAQGTIELSTSGDWIYKKEEKTEGYFLMKPKDLQTKVVDWKQYGSQFSDEMLRLMNKDISKEKEKLTSDSEIKFTVLSEKNGKIFIEISSSTEDEFPIGSFSMEKYDEKKDKVKAAPDPKTASKKEGKSSASVTPDDTRAEAPAAHAPHTKTTPSESIETDIANTLNLGSPDKTKLFMKDAKEDVRYIKSLDPNSYFIQFGAFNTARECFDYENDFLRNLESLYVRSDSPKFMRIPLLTKDRKPAVAIVFGPFESTEEAKNQITGDGQTPPRHWVRSTKSLKDVVINLP